MAGVKAAGVLCLLLVVMVVATSSSSQCHAQAEEPGRSTREKNAAVLSCLRYIGNDHPAGRRLRPDVAGACCTAVRAARSVRGICDELTEEDKAKISLDRWVQVASWCGRALSLGDHCAGLLVSSPAPPPPDDDFL